MKLRRILALLAALALTLSACSGGDEPTVEPDDGPEAPGEVQEEIELSLWIYPVGGWGNSSALSSMISSFHRANPLIKVSVREIDYNTGDQEIEDAVSLGKTPDIVFEGPERLSANWGARGLMADLGDLWSGETAGSIYDSVRAACVNEDGTSYIYPMCMTTHCMAVNRDIFEASGAWQYVDEETHTWTTEGFISAVAALREYGVENVGEVYCGGQGGDQGTRALINNLYGGTFTDPAHTCYTFNSEENIRALELLRSLDGINFNPSALGADEITMFSAGETAMTFCWNVANEVTQTISNPTLSFDIFPMAFPTSDGDIRLQGGIWGFGVFDNGDPGRIEAAKKFIRFMAEDVNMYTQAVLSLTLWPVRDVPNIYENDELMTEYFTLRKYMGDYYQVTPGWADARMNWWKMLQTVGEGGDISMAAEEFEAASNAAARGE